MARYEDGQATQFANDEMFNYDSESEELPGKEYFESFDENAPFAEGVKRRLLTLGFEENADTISALLKLCKEAEVSLSRQTISNWITKSAPSGAENSRENVYKLCFALKMNAMETGEFFLKSYMERPFNYKSLHEAVYFFCMNNGLGYPDAVRIITQAETLPIVEQQSYVEATEEIGHLLQRIRKEDALLSFLQSLRLDIIRMNQTAAARISALLPKCYELAEAEYNLYYKRFDEKPKTVSNEDELLAVIYGYNARETSGFWEKNGKRVPKPVYAKSISESHLPKVVRRNFPQRQQLEDIKKCKASYDTIRKTLILLSFYHFFADARIKIGDADAELGLYDEFVDEMNTVLADCGFVQLYWRNPFDWMIGHCAEKANPLEMLRDLIEEYYLSDPTIYNT